EQLSPSLSDEDCAILAHYVVQLKQKSLHHQKVTWELTFKGFMFTKIETEDSSIETAAKKLHSVRTFTKLYISAGNPQKAQTLTSTKPDGIGVLRSDFTYAQFGIHPGHIIHSRHREVLERQLTHAIS